MREIKKNISKTKDGIFPITQSFNNTNNSNIMIVQCCKLASIVAFLVIMAVIFNFIPQLYLNFPESESEIIIPTNNNTKEKEKEKDYISINIVGTQRYALPFVKGYGALFLKIEHESNASAPASIYALTGSTKTRTITCISCSTGDDNLSMLDIRWDRFSETIYVFKTTLQYDGVYNLHVQ